MVLRVSKRKDSYGVSALKDNGQLITDNQKQADILNSQFSSVFSRADCGSIPDLGPSPYLPQSIKYYSDNARGEEATTATQSPHCKWS